jgi:tRNA (guanine6-N2)-methyltransferase
MSNYQLSMFPGLGDAVRQETDAFLGVTPTIIGRLRNSEIASVHYDGDPSKLLGLRTVEDVFVRVGTLPLSGQTIDLKNIERAKIWGPELRQALAVWSKALERPLVKRQQFRVVVQADDVPWRRYRRVDMTLAGERALVQFGSSWRLSRDEAPLEIWMQQVGRELLVSVRLSTNEDRQHGGRAAELDAALRPSVAASMVQLAGISSDDVVLDPMCGTGTILLERAMAGRYKFLLGGDISQIAVTAALTNFGPRHKPREIVLWDATNLPLQDDSVNKIICNLPWGRQISTQAALPALYAKFLDEAARVLAAGGRIVLLTSEWDLMKKTIAHKAGLKLVRTVSNIEILGRRADIFMLEHV